MAAAFVVAALGISLAVAEAVRPPARASRGQGGSSGTVWHDRNRNGRMDGREPGVANVLARAVSADGAVLASTTSDRRGDFALDFDATADSGRGCTVEIAPPPGFHATTPVAVRAPHPAATGAARLAFGVTEYRTIALAASRVRALALGDLMERDWVGAQPRGAHRDLDLIVGADATGTDQLSVWFNRFDNNMLFNATRDYARTTPNSVLALAVDALTRDPAPFADRPDVIAGTRRSGAGNVFLWFNQNTTGNEGHIRTTYTLGYETLDHGDVHAIVTGDVAGGPGIDWIAGTRSAEARGSIEIWMSDDAAAPTFSRHQVITAVDDAGTPLGEVTGMILAKLRPGETDLVVGTRTADGAGQLVVFRREANGSRFQPVFLRTIDDGSVTAVAVCDLTRDGAADVVLGIRESSSRGRLDLWVSSPGEDLRLAVRDSRRLEAGYPLCLATGDLGGDPGPDLACGWRAGDGGTAGGLLVFSGDGRGLPFRGVDPSAGAVTGMVPALTIADFDRGAGSTVASSPSGDDIAAGVSMGSNHGSIVLFVR